MNLPRDSMNLKRLGIFHKTEASFFASQGSLGKSKIPSTSPLGPFRIQEVMHSLNTFPWLRVWWNGDVGMKWNGRRQTSRKDLQKKSQRLRCGGLPHSTKPCELSDSFFDQRLQGCFHGEQWESHARTKYFLCNHMQSLRLRPCSTAYQARSKDTPSLLQSSRNTWKLQVEKFFSVFSKILPGNHIPQISFSGIWGLEHVHWQLR